MKKETVQSLLVILLGDVQSFCGHLDKGKPATDVWTQYVHCEHVMSPHLPYVA